MKKNIFGVTYPIFRLKRIHFVPPYLPKPEHSHFDQYYHFNLSCKHKQCKPNKGRQQLSCASKIQECWTWAALPLSYICFCSIWCSVCQPVSDSSRISRHCITQYYTLAWCTTYMLWYLSLLLRLYLCYRLWAHQCLAWYKRLFKSRVCVMSGVSASLVVENPIRSSFSNMAVASPSRVDHEWNSGMYTHCGMNLAAGSSTLLVLSVSVVITVIRVKVPEYDDKALMIVTFRLSCLMLRESRAVSSTFNDLWTWLNERCQMCEQTNCCSLLKLNDN